MDTTNGISEHASKISPLGLMLLSAVSLLTAGVFFSMLWQPQLFARLMSAPASETALASAGGLSRVSANTPLSGVITPTTMPGVSVMPTTRPGVTLMPTTRPGVTVMPTSSIQKAYYLRAALSVQMISGVVITPANKVVAVAYQCYRPDGSAGSQNSDILTPNAPSKVLTIIANDNDCKVNVVGTPVLPAGYAWGDPEYQVSTRIDAAGNRHQTTFIDLKMMSTSATVVAPTVTRVPTVTRIPTATRSPIVDDGRRL